MRASCKRVLFVDSSSAPGDYGLDMSSRGPGILGRAVDTETMKSKRRPPSVTALESRDVPQTIFDGKVSSPLSKIPSRNKKTAQVFGEVTQAASSVPPRGENQARGVCATPDKNDRCFTCDFNSSDVDSPAPGASLFSPGRNSRKRSKFTRFSRSWLGPRSRVFPNDKQLKGHGRLLKRSAGRGASSPTCRGLRLFLEQFFVKVRALLGRCILWPKLQKGGGG